MPVVRAARLRLAPSADTSYDTVLPVMARHHGEVPDIPPRGPALPEEEMLLTFDVDCGELVTGHHFIARGICDTGRLTWDNALSAPGFTLEYELVPGVEADEDRRSPFGYLVGIEYSADVPLPWEAHDSGAIAPARGGVSTHGSRGNWPLPRSARVLRFALTGVDAQTGSPRSESDGTLVVDLQEERAEWEPRR